MTGPAGVGRRHPANPRLRRLARAGLVLAALALLASCQSPPRNHYRFSSLPFAPAEGWAQLPTAQWLLDAGVRPEVIFFCRAADCGEDAVILRLTLHGREAGLVDRLAEDPGRLLLAAHPTYPARKPRSGRQIGRDVARIAAPGWTGAIVALESASHPGRAAHVAILGRNAGGVGQLSVAIAQSASLAGQLVRQALD